MTTGDVVKGCLHDRATAWVPDSLIDAPVEAEDASTARLSERAAGAVVRLGNRLPAAWEPLARMMLRAEGMASSNIEGLRVPAEAVAGAQMNASGGTAGWVADDLTVVHQALADTEAPLSIDTMHEWHDPHDVPSSRRQPGTSPPSWTTSSSTPTARTSTR